MVERRAALPEIMARLEAVRDRMQVFFSVEDLRYARMSGRVGLSRMLLVSALNIKLMLTVRAGKLELFHRVRGRSKALQAMVDALVDRLTAHVPARLAVIHAQAPEAAEQVRQALLARVRDAQVIVRDLSLGIAVHFGPGTVGVIGYNP